MKRDRVDALHAAAFRVPTSAAEGDGTLTWDATTIVVVRARCGDTTGLGWTYCDSACVDVVEGVLGSAVTGADPLAVPAAWHAMQRRIRNLGRSGVVACAMSAVDIALWDLSARLCGAPVTRLLGRVRDAVDVYGSGGFTTFDDGQLRDQLAGWMRDGLPRVKIKIGESWGTAVDRDLDRVRRTRTLVGPDVEVYVDANGGYQAGQAIRVGKRLAELGVTWFEEPVSSDDLHGLREVRQAVDMDVAAGEYGYDLPYFARMVLAGAVDCLQVDLTRCGGFTEWARVAAVAAARNLQVSAHCAPNLAVHAGAVTPNFRHVEWFSDHDRIERTFFDGAVTPRGGVARPDLAEPGHGLTFRPERAEPFRVR
ncbi:enolase C-terminal domain-like protein [Allokutzneria oryzae]|uniref:Enolase C-terminal domain-like protein n=1 Tax=Allokutzneria oryzae TaxID=1378989 RepID=A0ABV6A8L1_9PSEU